MATRIIETEHERTMLVRFIEGHKLPMTANITAAGKRTSRQNKLNRQWMQDIAAQLEGWDPEYARAYCKLHHGVPILRNDDEAFCAEYDLIIRPLPYEHKIKLMSVPFDFGVTRLMNVKQQTAYLNAVHLDFSGMGVVLTDPGDLLAQADMKAAA